MIAVNDRINGCVYGVKANGLAFSLVTRLMSMYIIAIYDIHKQIISNKKGSGVNLLLTYKKEGKKVKAKS